MRTLREIEVSAAEAQAKWVQVARGFRKVRDGQFAEMEGYKRGTINYDYAYRAALGNMSFNKWCKVRWDAHSAPSR